jgi:hypothetical protein
MPTENKPVASAALWAEGRATCDTYVLSLTSIYQTVLISLDSTKFTPLKVKSVHRLISYTASLFL